MERKLFLILISIVAAALGLGGCGDDPTPINREPAGEACAAGGVRIGEGDEAFFICHSSVAEEAPGENCAAGGLRVEDGEGVRYVCSALPDDEEGLRIEALPIDEALLHCGSEWHSLTSVDTDSCGGRRVEVGLRLSGGEVTEG